MKITYLKLIEITVNWKIFDFADKFPFLSSKSAPPLVNVDSAFLFYMLRTKHIVLKRQHPFTLLDLFLGRKCRIERGIW